MSLPVVDPEYVESEPETPASVWSSAPPFRRLHLVVLFAVVLLGRWGIAVGGRYPYLPHDEYAQLAIARVVGRAGDWTMADLATWQPGLGILLAPVAALFHDPSTMYQVSLAVNCLIGAAGAVVFASLVRRVVARGVAPDSFGLYVAAIIALSPGQIRTSALVWAEPAVFALFALTVLCLVETARQDPLRWPVGAIGAAAIGYLFHGRMLPVFVVTVFLAIWLSRRGGLRRPVGLATWGAVAYGLVATTSHAVIERVWAEPSGENSISGTLSRLDDPLGLVVSLIGQVWYLQASSLMLFGIGAVVVIRGAIRRDADRLVAPMAARIMVASIGTAMLTSILFMAGRTGRGDHIIYGRYNEAAAGLVVVFGIAWVIRSAITTPVRLFGALVVSLAATFGGAWAITSLRGDTLQTATIARVMVTGIAPFVFGPPRDLLEVTGAAALVSVLLVLVLYQFGRRPRACLAVAIVLVVVGGLRTWDVQRQSRSTLASLTDVGAATEVVPMGVPIGIEVQPDGTVGAVGGSTTNPGTFIRDRVALSWLQFHLPDRTIVPWFGTGTPPEFTFGSADSARLASVGDVVWSDPDFVIVLWRVSPASDA